MKLSKFKEILSGIETLNIGLPNGELVPSHYHVTEVGNVTKKFIDCGGVIREEKVVNFQLWHANDYDHRLHPEKLLNIINLSEQKIGVEDQEIEVEYQSDTIGKYGLSFNGERFVLETKMTACLAQDACGVPEEKIKVNLSDLVTNSGGACTPGGNCC